jgi:diguanylate cyclase (GGDEF)-like protein
MAREVAAQTALAVHNARLLAEYQRQADELTARLRVSHAVSSSLQLEEVLEEVARASLGVAGAESCEIEIWHPDRDATQLIAQQAIADWANSKDNVGTFFPIDDWPMTRRILTTRQPLLFDEADPTLSDYERTILFDDSTRSGFSVPIVVDDQSLGVLSLFSRQPNAFSTRSLALGQDLASQAALAIERARLHAAIQERARTDALTGLLNRGAIEEELDLELVRARRSGQAMAVLVIDLDDFKQVNDRHGHLVGDRVLQHTADLLKHAVRQGDHVGRYGGDEFLVVLPNADASGAVATAERILAAGRSVRIAINREAIWLAVHLSIGFAVYPDNGSDHEELISAADRAMYAVKPAPKVGVTDFEAARRSRATSTALTANS